MFLGPSSHNRLFLRAYLSLLPSFSPLSRPFLGSFFRTCRSWRPSALLRSPQPQVSHPDQVVRPPPPPQPVTPHPPFLCPMYRVLPIPPVVFIQPKISSPRSRRRRLTASPGWHVVRPSM